MIGGENFAIKCEILKILADKCPFCLLLNRPKHTMTGIFFYCEILGRFLRLTKTLISHQLVVVHNMFK